MSKSIKFCRPIISENVSDLISKIKETDSQYQYVELWIDYISDLNLDNFNKIIEVCKKEVIILTRRRDLEDPKLAKNKRFEIIEDSIKKGLIIDCDLRQKDELIFLVEKGFQKILLSYHNYEETPKNLDAIYKEMQSYKPQIYKFACFCNTLQDSLDLLNLGLMLKSTNDKCIVTGMGVNGKIVRLASATWFNEFNFAPASNVENTANGQLTIEQLKMALNILEMDN